MSNKIELKSEEEVKAFMKFLEQQKKKERREGISAFKKMLFPQKVKILCKTCSHVETTLVQVDKFSFTPTPKTYKVEVCASCSSLVENLTNENKVEVVTKLLKRLYEVNVELSNRRSSNA